MAYRERVSGGVPAEDIRDEVRICIENIRALEQQRSVDYRIVETALGRGFEMLLPPRGIPAEERMILQPEERDMLIATMVEATGYNGTYAGAGKITVGEEAARRLIVAMVNTQDATVAGEIETRLIEAVRGGRGLDQNLIARGSPRELLTLDGTRGGLNRALLNVTEKISQDFFEDSRPALEIMQPTTGATDIMRRCESEGIAHLVNVLNAMREEGVVVGLILLKTPGDEKRLEANREALFRMTHSMLGQERTAEAVRTLARDRLWRLPNQVWDLAGIRG